jgi:di/tricarboxylate transporter
VLIAPIAIDAARQIGGDPRSMLIAVAIAASAGFLTPVAHQSNVLVMNPGGYRFGDYLKVGLPLDLLTLLVVVVVMPLVWPWP